MKKIVLVLLLCKGMTGFSQYDTSYMHAVINYLDTPEFKASLQRLTDQQTERYLSSDKVTEKQEGRYRKKQQYWVDFWTTDPARLTPYSYVITQRDSANKIDSIIVLAKNPNHLGAGLYAWFIHPDIVELRYFQGTRPFGYEDIVVFKVDADRKVTLTDHRGIIMN